MIKANDCCSGGLWSGHTFTHEGLSPHVFENVCHVKRIRKAHASLVLKCLFGLSSAFHSASDDVGFIIQKKSFLCFPGNKKPQRHHTCAVHQPVHVCGDWENFRWPSASKRVLWALLLLLHMFSWCFRGDFESLYTADVSSDLKSSLVDDLHQWGGVDATLFRPLEALQSLHTHISGQCQPFIPKWTYFKSLILMGWYNDCKWH